MGWLLTALKAIAAACGFGEKVVAEVHDSNQRTAGADHLQVKNLQISVERDHDAAKVREDVAGLSDAELDAELRRPT